MSEVVWFALASFTVVTLSDIATRLRRILRILERQQKAREHEMFLRIQGG